MCYYTCHFILGASGKRNQATSPPRNQFHSCDPPSTNIYVLLATESTTSFIRLVPIVPRVAALEVSILQPQLEPSGYLLLPDPLRVILPTHALQELRILSPITPNRILTWVRIIDILKALQKTHFLCNAGNIFHQLCSGLLYDGVECRVGP